MKKVSLITLLLCMTYMVTWAQSAPYNPFTQNIHYAPEPTVAGFECGSTPSVVFTQGLLTASDALNFATEPLKVTVCLTGFTFANTTNAGANVSGSYGANFTWAFDPLNANCIIGTQNQILYGTGTDPLFPNTNSSGDVIVALKVPETSPISTVLGVNIDLIIPPYMDGTNQSADDQESSYTQTFCPLKITGTVFIDNNNDGNVNGIPTNTAGNNTFCTSLIGANGLVAQTTTVAADGTYEFTNVNPNTTYNVILTNGCGIVGNPPPTSNIVGMWSFSGEDCCDNLGTDGDAMPNGSLTVPVTNASVINVNFGVRTAALPLTLKSFNAYEYNCNALLNWSTASEENTSYTEIYRKDGPLAQYVKIAEVKSAGFSSSTRDYSYLDRSAKQQATPYEYKLKFVDIDGQYTYSEVKSVSLKCGAVEEGVNIFPNPASNSIFVSFQTANDNPDGVLLKADVLDIAGKVIMTHSEVVMNGATLVEFNVSQLAKGTYMIRYENVDEHKSGSMKFTKE